MSIKMTKEVSKLLKKLKNTVAVLLLIAINTVCVTTVYAASDKIEVYASNGMGSTHIYSFESPFKKRIDSPLKLGDTITSQIVKIISSSSDKYKISVKFETSLSMMDEGPHLDLIKWRHCTTDWINLKSLQPNQYRLPSTESFDESCFPNVSDEEIRTEVQRLGGKDWSSLLKGDIDVHQYPLTVSLSAVKLRIQKEVNGTLETITIIHFKVPMGC